MHDHPSKWYNYLALAKWSYNRLVHSSTGHTLFEVIYGKTPLSIPQYILGSSNVEVFDMKIQADIKQKDVTYNEGEWVYVKLWPYRQLTVSQSPHHKLYKKFYSPF